MKTLREIKHERIKRYANSLRNTLQWTLAALILESEKPSKKTKAAITAARKELTRITPEKLNR